MDTTVFEELFAKPQELDLRKSQSGFTTYLDIATELFWKCWCAAQQSVQADAEQHRAANANR